MEKKTKKTLMIGAALVGGYLLLSNAGAPATPADMSGGGGGFTLLTEGTPETKKEDLISYTEADAPVIPTDYSISDKAALYTAETERLKWQATQGGGAGGAVTKKEATTAATKAQPALSWKSGLMATSPVGAAVVAVKHRKQIYSTAKKVISKIWGWA